MKLRWFRGRGFRIPRNSQMPTALEVVPLYGEFQREQGLHDRGKQNPLERLYPLAAIRIPHYCAKQTWLAKLS